MKNGSAIQDLTKIENPKEKTIRQVILDLRAHNKSLESTINKLMTGSSSIKDKTMVDSYLVKSGKGKALTTEPAQCVAAIKRLPTFAGQQQIIAELESLYTLPEGEKGDWVTFRFKGMPVMAVIPLLNKWYFENLKAERVLLNQLTN